MRKNVYVFTGGASGMGLASARSFVEEGVILLADRNAAALEDLAKEFQVLGAEVYTRAADVTNRQDMEALAEYAASLGDIRAVIHTAGVTPASSPRDTIIRVNALGTIYAVQAFYPHLAEGGVMICFSSKASYVFDGVAACKPLIPLVEELSTHWYEETFFQQMQGFIANVMQSPEEQQAGSAYTLTKYFVRQFVKMNVKRFADKGCRILSISPGSYLTPMHQALIDNAPEQAAGDMATIYMKRWGHPYEMAALVKFLCSRGAGYITGVDILADGGGSYLTLGVPQIE